jgi:hypothetical protein
MGHRVKTHGVDDLGIYDQYCTSVFKHPRLLSLATMQILGYAQEMEGEKSITL